MTEIAELFARDPLELTRTDIEMIVDRMRNSRHQFAAGNLKAGSTKPKTEKQKKAEELAKKVSLDVTDLF